MYAPESSGDRFAFENSLAVDGRDVDGVRSGFLGISGLSQGVGVRCAFRFGSAQLQVGFGALQERGLGRAAQTVGVAHGGGLLLGKHLCTVWIAADAEGDYFGLIQRPFAHPRRCVGSCPGASGWPQGSR
ncbi:hypothetical protein, partial [uncultured Limnohabitans sp.]|uniref:hypothetical protein n=1 Tax=uncultured Limnohabitans sp. TaxID=768543 RepID=UPI00262E1E53